MPHVAYPPRRSPIGWIVIAFAAGLLILGCWAAIVVATAPANAATVCMASYYGTESGTVTASGERFRPEGFTAAHRTYPFGTRLRVTWHGHSVTVRVNDRGPAAWTGKCLDLSKGAARALGMIRSGTARVSIDRLN